jgi:hypothetical protein
MMYTEWGVSDICVTYTSFCIHHMSLTPHSVYIICHLHLILYTSYVTYTSFCIHHMSLQTEWGVTYDAYRMRCKWHMMYTEWGVSEIWYIQNEVWHMMSSCHLHFILYTSYVTPHSVYIKSHLHLILYTSYVTYTSFCTHHMSHLILFASYAHYLYRMRCKWHMRYTEWGDIWCIQNEV